MSPEWRIPMNTGVDRELVAAVVAEVELRAAITALQVAAQSLNLVGDRQGYSACVGATRELGRVLVELGQAGSKRDRREQREADEG
jgi:hypothetical protein